MPSAIHNARSLGKRLAWCLSPEVFAHEDDLRLDPGFSEAELEQAIDFLERNGVRLHYVPSKGYRVFRQTWHRCQRFGAAY